MDLGRLDFFCAAHLWRRNRAQSLYAILQSVEISFIRSIFPGDSIKLCTSIVGIDEKYCYIEQTFYIHNQLMAHARVRSILYDGHGKRVTINTLALFQKFPSLPGSITQWKNYLSQKTLESPTIHPHF
jgi:acyl-CoA thioesterase FadM